jgi:hypothetical protein
LAKVNVDGRFESRFESEVTKFDTACGEEAVSEGGEMTVELCHGKFPFCHEVTESTEILFFSVALCLSG